MTDADDVALLELQVAVLFMVALCNRETIYIYFYPVIMAALSSRCGHYIFAL